MTCKGLLKIGQMDIYGRFLTINPFELIKTYLFITNTTPSEIPDAAFIAFF